VFKGSFGENSALTSINDQTFCQCRSLKNITIPDNITHIGYQAFAGCTVLATITFGENSQLKTIDEQAFVACKGLTSVTFPICLEAIESCAFQATGLTNVTIPASVTKLGDSAFDNCENLKEATVNASSIGSGAFGYCLNLEKVNLTSNVKVISNDAFLECSNLKTIVFPSSITNLGAHIFQGCTNLTDCIFDGNEAGWIAVTKDKNWYDYSLCEGHYTQGYFHWHDSNILLSKATYKYTLNENEQSYTWNGFAEGFHSRNIILPTKYNELPITAINWNHNYSVSFSKIYFEGTSEEWAAIANSTFTTGATIYTYSETEPTGEGNYWRYIDGIPMVW